MKFYQKTLLLLVLLAAFGLASCTSFKASGLTYSVKTPATTVIKKFQKEIWVNGFLGGSAGIKLFNIMSDITDPLIAETIEKEVKAAGGDAAIDITINYQATFVNLLLNSVTAGIYAPATLEIAGTIVKYN